MPPVSLDEVVICGKSNVGKSSLINHLSEKKVAKEGIVDAIICLGCVIRGETPHFDAICREVSSGISHVALEYGMPVIFGVLTTDTPEQAHERSGGGLVL